MSRVYLHHAPQWLCLKVRNLSIISTTCMLNRLCRWAEVITHVPCGGSDENPAGRLLISTTLEAIDGAGGVIGSSCPSLAWGSRRTIILAGTMMFDLDDIANMEADGTFERDILHEMGLVIGIG